MRPSYCANTGVQYEKINSKEIKTLKIYTIRYGLLPGNVLKNAAIRNLSHLKKDIMSMKTETIKMDHHDLPFDGNDQTWSFP